MSVRFACRCGKKMRAADDKIGKKVLCPECGSPVLVPDSSTVAVEHVSAEGGASDTASSLLKGSAEEGKRRRGLQLEQGAVQEAAFDLLETAKFVGMSVLPGVLAVFGLAFLAYYLSSMVMGPDRNLPELGRVYGTVTLDGKPLVRAEVAFEPKTEDPATNVATSRGLTDEEGYYTLWYVRGVKGAAVGRHKVEIRLADENGRERLPVEYNIHSLLTADVKPGSNEIPFELRSN